ncbi:hypothetical protein OG792_07885 [Micromonospora sp. NBC_01699]|uniref:hypothetical protein n=1 Tax=Micromonospora sp. NBC_01699 TaxID=2975984 RepID=UPI002E36D656|nr:hypothetical protein [Micromonospora sp. NBC_01699]
MFWKLPIAVAGLVLLAAPMAGCGGVDRVNGSASAPAERSAGAGQGDIHVSRIKDYNTFAELKAESTVAVRATAGDARVEMLHGVPFTVTSVKLIGPAVWGQVPPLGALEVRQTGSATAVAADLSPLLVEGREYLLFVTPWIYEKGVPTGQWVITGDQGVYVLEGSGDSARYRFAGAPKPNLPAELTVEQVHAGSFPA